MAFRLRFIASDHCHSLEVEDIVASVAVAFSRLLWGSVVLLRQRRLHVKVNNLVLELLLTSSSSAAKDNQANKALKVGPVVGGPFSGGHNVPEDGVVGGVHKGLSGKKKIIKIKENN